MFYIRHSHDATLTHNELEIVQVLDGRLQLAQVVRTQLDIAECGQLDAHAKLDVVHGLGHAVAVQHFAKCQTAMFDLARTTHGQRVVMICLVLRKEQVKIIMARLARRRIRNAYRVPVRTHFVHVHFDVIARFVLVRLGVT